MWPARLTCEVVAELGAALRALLGGAALGRRPLHVRQVAVVVLLKPAAHVAIV